jgi:hypothetical protein
MSQLVFKIMKPSASFHGVDYNERKQEKGQATLVHVQHFGHLQDGRTELSRQDMKKYLSYYSGRNTRIKSPQFHAILSCKEKTFSFDQLKSVGLELMERMGYSSNPLLMYAHTDTQNNHIHIVSTRIDSTGRKIPDAYEGMKANRILSAIQLLNTQTDCQQAIQEALLFRFSSLAQFRLMMERKGYDCRQCLEQIALYKHGSQQGSLPLAVLKEKIEAYHIVPAELSRIRAIVLKYKGSHDCMLQKMENRYSLTSSTFTSPLTSYLHQHLGLEFVFFSGKQHDRPYGYAIIDHPHKTIYKGGDIMSLGQIIGRADEKRSFTPAINENDKTKGREKDRSPGAALNTNESNNIIKQFDHLIQNLEFQVEQDLKHERGSEKKKKKRQSW